MSLPLLQTKLYAPPPRHQLVPRDHLIDRLRNQDAHPLTLVCAPAGFGKTTLVGAWLKEMRQGDKVRGRQGDDNDPSPSHLITPSPCPAVAWLSLDEDDNDPARFLTYVIAALQTGQAKLGETVLALLTSPQPPPLKSILTLLLNELGALATPLTLVLDDYHVISAQPIHEALSFLIDHLPSQFRLIMTSRIDPPLPLARWRVRNQLIEVRADDLRFTPHETATFLNEVMGLTLSPTEITALESRTEGWIAGLQLAALSMQGRADVTSFIQAFSGSHRHVLSYLVEEVLNRCPPDTLSFLLQTSILDRMCAALCDAITEETNGQTSLAQLEQANLFLIPLDDEGKWYRYHHLFAEVLRQELQRRFSAEAVADLHRRASTWCQGAALIDEAIHHALAAPAFEQAATLVEQVALTMLLQSKFARLRLWLEALPAAAVQTRPLLLLYHVWFLYMSGQTHQAAAHLAAVEAMLAADETKHTPEVQELVAITQTRLLLEVGDLAGAIAISQQALANLPAQATLLRAWITLNLAIAHYLQGELSAADQLLTESITTGHTAQLIGPLPTIYLKAQIFRAQGGLQQALQLCQEGLELVARHHWQELPVSGFLYVTMGELLRECNDLSESAEYLEKGIKLGQAGGHHHILIIGYVSLAWLRQNEGNIIGSQEAIDAALQLIQQHAISRFWPLPSAACCQARLWIAQGNLAAAGRWAQSSGLNQDPTLIPYLDEAVYVTLARLRIGEGNLAVAASLLLNLHQTAAAAGRNGSLIEILILQAVTYAAQQQSEKAMSALAQVLILAEPEGYIRLFIDEGEAMRLLMADFRFWFAQQPLTEQNANLVIYIDQLLAKFGSEQLPLDEPLISEPTKIQNRSTEAHERPKSKIQNLVEPLSERELEVLQLVAAGLANGEIADRLIVSTSTVKTHVNRIFGKLAVQSRTQAIGRARALGLLRD